MGGYNKTRKPRDSASNTECGSNTIVKAMKENLKTKYKCLAKNTYLENTKNITS